ncbi:MAG TPA: DUF2795 domain-containing protein [Micromonosporaceae bacterium]
MIEARWADVAEALNNLDFPATKDDIVEHARQRGAPEPVQRLLRGLPWETYANMSEIRRAAPPDPAVDDGLGASELARKRRGRHHPHGRRIAEYIRDTD